MRGSGCARARRGRGARGGRKIVQGGPLLQYTIQVTMSDDHKKKNSLPRARSSIVDRSVGRSMEDDPDVEARRNVMMDAGVCTLQPQWRRTRRVRWQGNGRVQLLHDSGLLLRLGAGAGKFRWCARSRRCSSVRRATIEAKATWKAKRRQYTYIRLAITGW